MSNNLLNERVLTCENCVLRATCRRPVPGAGNFGAKIMIIGEAPGKEEDIQWAPFVGRSGKLLTNILESLDLLRERDYYITNIVKCRPPENRDPLPGEISTCSPYLVEQINLMKPELIITLGRFSFNFLVPNVTIGEWHGNSFQIDEISWMKLDCAPTVLSIYHPAVALYNPNKKSIIIEDLQKIPAILEKLRIKN